jgi:hypothetical protein
VAAVEPVPGSVRLSFVLLSEDWPAMTNPAARISQTAIVA